RATARKAHPRGELSCRPPGRANNTSAGRRLRVPSRSRSRNDAMNPSRVRLPFWLLPAAVLAVAAGCVPNVVWLADSSGFVFTRKEGNELVFYDAVRR